MTRKDFELIAAALASTKPDEFHSDTTRTLLANQWVADVEAVMEALSTTNPRFDRQRFLSACEGS